MRVKKQKVNRRTVRFYKTCFGFRQPFKVLCDGTFLHYTQKNKMGSPDVLLSALLSAPAKTFITRCSVAELRKLGVSFSGTVSTARSLNTARCNHEPLKSASECLEGIIGDGNPDHYFVATQDVELRRKLRQMPGVAIILAQNNFLILEPPSKKQQGFVHTSEAERTHVKEREYIALEARERRKQVQSAFAAQNLSQEAEKVETSKLNMTTVLGSEDKVHKRQKNLGVKELPRFKRKRAKAPNPLSCKKKKVKPPSNESQSQVDAENKPLSRKRRRRHRTKISMEAGNTNRVTDV